MKPKQTNVSGSRAAVSRNKFANAISLLLAKKQISSQPFWPGGGWRSILPPQSTDGKNGSAQRGVVENVDLGWMGWEWDGKWELGIVEEEVH
jgi:hypothetical protein